MITIYTNKPITKNIIKITSIDLYQPYYISYVTEWENHKFNLCYSIHNFYFDRIGIKTHKGYYTNNAIYSKTCNNIDFSFSLFEIKVLTNCINYLELMELYTYKVILLPYLIDDIKKYIILMMYDIANDLKITLENV